ncbi:metal-dependent hydrolase [Aquimarina sp. TRL1]|uniref:metal-dependent hydrolase n=1 Tax=Aquimarina sp. (strain TRL1) TaxID=2736252 RepID=UPI00158F1E72|nr:metal-dependent hydrolase [Aquimarina sp. TRL1]QKX07396.1 metal-dependent hydrolase [Aquimarina sp. TRL1]
MASIFGHAMATMAIGSSFPKEFRSFKFWLLGIGCTMVPDADVIGFKLHIAYNSFWGHRGFTHSILFAILWGMSMSFIFYPKLSFSLKGILFSIFFAFCTLSHGILDAMTTGGLGVAFFSPFDDTRYFFPWRPIEVSPIGARKFISMRGLSILINEGIWIGVPSLIYTTLVMLLRKNTNH